MTKKRPLFIFTYPCPVCKEEKELSKELEQHMLTHLPSELREAGVKVIE